MGDKGVWRMRDRGVWRKKWSSLEEDDEVWRRGTVESEEGKRGLEKEDGGVKMRRGMEGSGGGGWRGRGSGFLPSTYWGHMHTPQGGGTEGIAVGHTI